MTNVTDITLILTKRRLERLNPWCMSRVYEQMDGIGVLSCGDKPAGGSKVGVRHNSASALNRGNAPKGLGLSLVPNDSQGQDSTTNPIPVDGCGESSCGVESRHAQFSVLVPSLKGHLGHRYYETRAGAGVAPGQEDSTPTIPNAAGRAHSGGTTAGCAGAGHHVGNRF